MLAIARYALKGPFHAATVAGILAILSLFIPLVSILSGAMVGLIILTQGLRSGAWVILVSVVGISVVSFLLTRSPILGITIGLVQWLPMMMLAEMLRRTNSLSFTFLLGAGFSLLAVAAQFTLWPQSEQVWLQFVTELFSGVDRSDPEIAAQFDQMLQNMVHWMTVLVIAVMYSTFVATLLVARWLQARLADSSGYRDEFYALSLGKTAAGLTLLLLVVSLPLQMDWMTAMLAVMLAGFFFQGVAIAHNWAKQRGSRNWLIVLYVLMFIVPQTLLVVAVLGIIDNWMNFRAKLKKPSGNPD